MNLDSMCSICLGNVVNRAKPDNCQHIFCYSCLFSWSEINCNCPYCRTEMSTIHSAFDGKNYNQTRRVTNETIDQTTVEESTDSIDRRLQENPGKTNTSVWVFAIFENFKPYILRYTQMIR